MKQIDTHSCGGRRQALALTTVLAFALFAVPAGAQTLFRQLSQDTFTGGNGQHKSEVEPAAFAHGPVIVAAFQVARVSGGGGMDIGWATSLNGGIAWTNGYLPGLTSWYQGGVDSAASDAAVAYDQKHGIWLINTLPIGNSGVNVAVSRSTDALHWDNPIFVSRAGDADKNWIACDNTSSSPFYGNCYVGWDNSTIQMTTSTDGGLTWSTAKATQCFDSGIGIQPVIQANGNVIVGFADFGGGMSAFMSTNGGQSWTCGSSISSAPSHGEAGGLRSAGLPSTAIDGAGTVYVSWPDCRFESNCTANDIVFSKSTDGTHWSAVSRIPIDPVGSGVDHFIHGMGIDPNTSGASAHIGLTYYYYPVSNCGNSCTLIAGWTQSSDGGTTWTAGRQASAGMQLSWLPNTFSGRMVADYVMTVFSGPRAFPIYVIAKQPSGGLLQQAVYTEGYGFAFTGTEPTYSSANDVAIPGIQSDHPPRRPEDRDNLMVPPQSR